MKHIYRYGEGRSHCGEPMEAKDACILTEATCLACIASVIPVLEKNGDARAETLRDKMGGSPIAYLRRVSGEVRCYQCLHRLAAEDESGDEALKHLRLYAINVGQYKVPCRDCGKECNPKAGARWPELY